MSNEQGLPKLPQELVDELTVTILTSYSEGSSDPDSVLDSPDVIRDKLEEILSREKYSGLELTEDQLRIISIVFHSTIEDIFSSISELNITMGKEEVKGVDIDAVLLLKRVETRGGLELE